MLYLTCPYPWTDVTSGNLENRPFKRQIPLGGGMAAAQSLSQDCSEEDMLPFKMNHVHEAFSSSAKSFLTVKYSCSSKTIAQEWALRMCGDILKHWPGACNGFK